MSYKPCHSCGRYKPRSKTCDLSGHEVFYCRTDPHDECGPDGARWVPKRTPAWVYALAGVAVGAAIGLLF